MGNYFVYILKCSDGTYYTGYTSNLKRRIKEHNNGTGAKYTKGRRPVILLYYETFDEQSEAMSREYQIKQLNRGKKENLVKSL